ncbi:hypothetical protein Pmani_024194 [Petrolisthes manimaculis]|uniref:RNase H type-1 domain-containing protein n=1 Tax=Petrolisthes manimaculis TaxID=1843537 RepID=A0AAE1PAA9_9EUCA|nr:hypothetical protein Pmani_024194 [Petrolisthes manimaculis]
MSALQAISSVQPTHRILIHQILHQLVTAQELSLCIRYLWIPSHVGIVNNDKVDLLAKAACELPLPDDATPSLFRYKGIIHSASLLPTLPFSLPTGIQASVAGWWGGGRTSLFYLQAV